MSGVQTYDLGDFKLQSGETIPKAFIAYKTFGESNLPAILYPSWYSGAIADNEWLIGEDKALNPKLYFIIITALFGNGQSTSPSNSDINPFPNVTFYDNVKAQHQLLTQKLNITHLRMVTGWSMGAGQSFQWATQFPDFMDICVPFCGSAKTSNHNQVFLEGVKSALLAAKGISSAGSTLGTTSTEPRKWTAEEKAVGLKAFGRGYAGWGFSQTFYREKLHEKMYGAKNLEDFMVSFWETWAQSKDPENLLVMLHTWQAGDVSKQEPYNGDFEAAMAAIKAKTLVLPSKTDLYFPPEDSEYEVECMKPGVGVLDVYPSIWGHWAGGPPGNMDDVKWLDDRLGKLLKGEALPTEGIEQAKKLANEAVEAAKPYVDSAQKSAQPYVDSAQKNAQPYVDSAQKNAQPYLDSAQKSAQPYLDQASKAISDLVSGEKK